jgi:biotin-dependent carboxylase-like uncharacterized protein
VSALRVIQPGLLSLLQDRGRFGHAGLGLTTGGPADPQAFALAQRLLGNDPDCTALEVSFGGLEIEAQAACDVAVTGATLPVTVNERERPQWQTLRLEAGDRLRLGFSETGCRSYLAVGGGFDIRQQFGSTATVVREGLGGLNGGPLREGDRLPFHGAAKRPVLWLPPSQRPRYHHRATLRVIPGYQVQEFPRLAQRRFFASEYAVTDRADRMGYRLQGPATRADRDGILSEGIALGAVQFPADGQPIVLLQDRQTIGGYPKIGCVLSLDCAALAQLRPGDRVNFTPITEHAAHNALHLAAIFERARRIEPARA